jgi:hypothetical protein
MEASAKREAAKAGFATVFARKRTPPVRNIYGGFSPRTNQQVIEEEHCRLSQRLDDVARLCESGLAPPAFYGELLQRLLESLAAVAGSVWIHTPQGNLQQQFQINMQQLGLSPEPRSPGLRGAGGRAGGPAAAGPLDRGTEAPRAGIPSPSRG